mgnify:CR=1 FL=1
MKKEFNTVGLCIKDMHYMVDMKDRIEHIKLLIEKDRYFTINRARQYGKTTLLNLLYEELKEKYFVIKISFEGIGSKAFTEEYLFLKTFINLCSKKMRGILDEKIILNWEEKSDELTFENLGTKISNLINETPKEVILIIDEVDKTSDNQLFLDFLGILRSKYLDKISGDDNTFKSVILAGVYDIKNIKRKLKADEEIRYNSPWNIAVDFNVDMNFNLSDIAGMLEEYEKEENTKMNILDISHEIYSYTNGYPFLVSKICKTIDEELNKNWTIKGVRNAVKLILKGTNTLFDDMIKNIENNEMFRNLIEMILVKGREIPFQISDPIISFGAMLGILINLDDKVIISNRIFEMYIYNHMVIRKITHGNGIISIDNSQFIVNNILNMEKILIKFMELMKSEYREEDKKFLEREGRLLFLCFLKPIINGKGHYAVETQTRNNTRMDIVVFYGEEEYIIELKIWHGEEARKAAIDQLKGYLNSKNKDKGYLVSFCFNKNKDYTAKWIKDEEKDIFEVRI